jgi:hypothetical protein
MYRLIRRDRCLASLALHDVRNALAEFTVIHAILFLPGQPPRNAPSSAACREFHFSQVEAVEMRP